MENSLIIESKFNAYLQNEKNENAELLKAFTIIETTLPKFIGKVVNLKIVNEINAALDIAFGYKSFFVSFTENYDKKKNYKTLYVSTTYNNKVLPAKHLNWLVKLNTETNESGNTKLLGFEKQTFINRRIEMVAATEGKFSDYKELLDKLNVTKKEFAAYVSDKAITISSFMDMVI